MTPPISVAFGQGRPCSVQRQENPTPAAVHQELTRPATKQTDPTAAKAESPTISREALQEVQQTIKDQLPIVVVNAVCTLDKINIVLSHIPGFSLLPLSGRL